MQNLFPSTTRILAPSTSATAINPCDLAARGAAIQASLIQDFDLEDIKQSAHPMVTVTPHLRNAVGVLLVTDDTKKGAFIPVLEAETAAPARRTVLCKVPKDGGDVIVKVCEGIREIKVSKKVPAKTNGKGAESDDEGEEDESSEEEEEVREKAWKVGKVLAEAGMRGVKKGGKLEVMINVGGDLGVLITVREVGGKHAVRGTLNKADPNGVSP
jgi:hypothetical protein